MKNKLRKITVENESYFWRIAPYADDPNFVLLRVWVDGQKSAPWITVFYRYDNPWHHYAELIIAPQKAREYLQLQPMLPSKVADIIKQSVSIQKENPGFNKVYLRIDDNGKLYS